MAWVRIHDGALSHPKLVSFIDWRNPFDVWVWGLSYAQMHLTDGFIPKAALPNSTALRTAAKLVDAQLWHDQGTGYQVHDYLDWNDSKATILRERKKSRERQAAWRAARDAQRNGSSKTSN